MAWINGQWVDDDELQGMLSSGTKPVWGGSTTLPFYKQPTFTSPLSTLNQEATGISGMFDVPLGQAPTDTVPTLSPATGINMPTYIQGYSPPVGTQETIDNMMSLFPVSQTEQATGSFTGMPSVFTGDEVPVAGPYTGSAAYPTRTDALANAQSIYDASSGSIDDELDQIDAWKEVTPGYSLSATLRDIVQPTGYEETRMMGPEDSLAVAPVTEGLGHTGGKTTAPFATDFLSGTVFPAVTGEDYDLYNDAQQTVEDWRGLGLLDDWDAGVMKGHQLSTVGAKPGDYTNTLGGALANTGFSVLQPLDQIVDEWGTANPLASAWRGALGSTANLQGQLFGPPDTPVTAAYELMNQGIRPPSHFAMDKQGNLSPALSEMVSQVDTFALPQESLSAADINAAMSKAFDPTGGLAATDPSLNPDLPGFLDESVADLGGVAKGLIGKAKDALTVGGWKVGASGSLERPVATVTYDIPAGRKKGVEENIRKPPGIEAANREKARMRDIALEQERSALAREQERVRQAAVAAEQSRVAQARRASEIIQQQLADKTAADQTARARQEVFDMLMSGRDHGEPSAREIDAAIQSMGMEFGGVTDFPGGGGGFDPQGGPTGSSGMGMWT